MIKLTEWQQKVDQWINKYGTPWPDFVVFSRLVEEVGEVGRVLSVKSGYRKREVEALETEIGDVLFTLIVLSNIHSINLDDSLEKTIEKYTKRTKELVK